METAKFEELVVKALGELPDEFQEKLENVDVTVQAYPTRRQLGGLRRGRTLLGLYEGVPHTSRTRGYNLVIPDKITLFQKPIEAECRSDGEIAMEIQSVVLHEIAHHFGLDDQVLRRIERGSRRKGGR